MSLGSDVIPLDWYSKSQQKMLVDLDKLYQEFLSDSVDGHFDGDIEHRLDVYERQRKRRIKIAKLRKIIGFDRT